MTRRRAEAVMLGLETSGPVCRVAVRGPRGTEERSAAGEFARHSDVLFGLLDRTLAAAGVERAELDGVAVSLGPGSFTGLRVGLAAAKVLAAFGRLPLAGVPTLAAMAHEGIAAAPGAAAILTRLPAGRGESYAALWRPDRIGAPRRVAGPIVGNPARLRPPPGAIEVTEPPRAAMIAALGAAALAAGRRDDPARLVPLYLRRPAAAERRRT